MINGIAFSDQQKQAEPAPVVSSTVSPPTPLPPTVALPKRGAPVRTILAALVVVLIAIGGGTAYYLSQNTTELRQQAAGPSIECDSPDWFCNGECASQKVRATFSAVWCNPAQQWRFEAGCGGTQQAPTSSGCTAGGGGSCTPSLCSPACSGMACSVSCPSGSSCVSGKATFYCHGKRGDGCNEFSDFETNSSGSINATDPSHWCSTVQIDAWANQPDGTGLLSSARVYFIGKNGVACHEDDAGCVAGLNWDCAVPTPTPPVQCPVAPRANCFYEADGSISANLTWSSGTVPAGAKYLIRADHQPTNIAQCTNTVTQQPVGWYCPAGGTNCLPGQVCDDRYVYITGTSTKIANIKNGDTYNWALQVDPNGCRIEAGSFRCARSIPTPSPSPSPTPIVYSCNSTCTTDAQCKTANSAYICYGLPAATDLSTDVLGVSTDTDRQIAAAAPGLNTGSVPGTGATPSPTLTSIGRCRLPSNPTSTTCQAVVPSPSPSMKPSPSPSLRPSPTPTIVPSPTPVVAPMCLNITLNSPNNPPKIGDTITLTCGVVAGASRYEFRVREPNGNIVVLNGLTTSRTSQSYQIATNGKFAAQCRICVTGGSQTICQEWEPMPGAPTSCTPMPPCVLTQACDIAEPAGGWCPASPTPTSSPAAQCVDEKCAQTVQCFAGGYSYCSTTPPTVGQCVCPDGAPQNKTDAEKAEEAAATTQETKTQ